MGAYLRTEDLTVGYDGKPVIYKANLQVDRGQILTLIGPNGSGKSTILKSLTRAIPLISGKVFIDTLEMRNIPRNKLARKMAVVLTERIRPELMTCFDVVATGRYPYTGALGVLGERDKRITMDVMDMVSMSHLAERDFTQTSDGQKQLLLLARAICQEPEIIILDEPTSYLDIRYKLMFLGIIKKLVKERSLAVIMSLHEIDLAKKVSDRVVCVKNEHVVSNGIPDRVLTDFYVSELFGIDVETYRQYYGGS